MNKTLLAAATIFVGLRGHGLWGQVTQKSPEIADSFLPLHFLEGTWEAKATRGSAAAESAGTYTFQRELGKRILARHSKTSTGCKGPETFDCDHGDLLYVYQEQPNQGLKAIYFDNEGHVIHYDVSTPTPNTAIFLSETSQQGPRFRLVYELKGTSMAGKFQMQIPGQADWKSYLEWTGSKK